MKLAGLDFETANGKRGSICAAGCAIVDDTGVTESREWLVCPHKGYRWMRPDFTDIHGLNYWDVCNCMEFPAVWPELQRKLLEADCVVIHNAPFDLGHLRSVLELYELPPVEFDYVDSLAVSCRLFPEMESHSLDAMAERFGIVFRHHNALEDATACARLIVQMGIPEGFIQHFNTLKMED
ncbi:MAG: 3'-5' exoribonuclease [Victivallales bacterium]|nr:3'-5' exoribonuclease [Victivallales bacterium]